MANPISNVVEGLAQRLFFQEMYVKLTDKTLSIFCMTRRYNENREIFNGGKPPGMAAPVNNARRAEKSGV